MKKIPKASSLNYKPLPKQLRAIDKLTIQLGILVDDPPRNRKEARDLIYKLRKELKGIE